MGNTTLIKLREVMRRTSRSKSYIYEKIKSGDFPQQVKIGSRSVAFIESEINDWIERKIAASRSTEAAQ